MIDFESENLCSQKVSVSNEKGVENEQRKQLTSAMHLCFGSGNNIEV